MIAFMEMLVQPAKEAQMSIPDNLNEFNPVDFPHWCVFVNVQIGKPVRYHGEHWHNAKVIANVSNDDIMNITVPELIDLGLSY